MKKNRMMRLASILLVCVLLSTSVISGTFAKYTTTASGSDTARVAKWDIVLEGSAMTNSYTIDLFTYTDANVDVNGNGTEKVIAPGTTGSFTIDIENHSEVQAKYSITLAETNANNIPLQYSVDGTTWVDSVAELTMTALTDVAIGMETGTGEHTVYWRWMFEGSTEGAHDGQNDASDTLLGIYAQNENAVPFVTITATITATQVD